MRRSLLAAVLLLGVTFTAQAWAQGAEVAPALGGQWSVQTVALRDWREAQSTAESLREHGFDAFTEFAMDGGLQFIRVRVGCYTTREAAEIMAEALRGRITEAAVVVEATPGAPVVGCVKMDVGFLKPVTLDEVDEVGLAPAFRVVVAGVEAHVTHTGQRWRVLQEGDSVPRVDPALPSVRCSQSSLGGVSLIAMDGPTGRVILCPGSLLDSVGGVAISEQGEALVACSLESMGGS